MPVATRPRASKSSPVSPRRTAPPDAKRWLAELTAALPGPPEPGPQAIALELAVEHVQELAELRAAEAASRKLEPWQVDAARRIRSTALVWLSRELAWLGLDRAQVRALDLGLRRRRGVRAAAAASPKPRAPTILQVMRHPKLLRRFFEPLETWSTWAVVLAAAFGLPPPSGNVTVRVRGPEGWSTETMSALDLFRRHTGRSAWPQGQASEFFNVVGIRGGKSRQAALIAVFLACFRSYRKYLAAGEIGTLMVLAADRGQARVVLGYIRAFLLENEHLVKLVTAQTAQSITLRNDVRIEVHTASFRSIRAYTLVGAICDEIAVWRAEGSANPDTEVLTALRSRVATIPIAMMVAISSPYARKGELWETYKRYFGKDDVAHTLVWQAPTWVTNPTVSREFIEREYERDPAKAQAEMGGEFRADVEVYVKLEDVEACTVWGRQHLPPVAAVQYRAFLDPSGGRGDAMVLAIGHLAESGRAETGGTVVVDLLLGFAAPFVPSQAVASMVPFLRQYGIMFVRGDRYGGEWARESFRDHGIEYELCAKGKSDLYVDLLPRLFSGRQAIELPDVPKLRVELVQLERRASRAGREMIDHPPHAHDDYANAVAGLAGELSDGPALSPVWGRRRK